MEALERALGLLDQALAANSRARVLAALQALEQALPELAPLALARVLLEQASALNPARMQVPTPGPEPDPQH